jgi:parallel beta-helix repeat protein
MSLVSTLHLAKAYEIIYIKADGTVDPPSAPIQRSADNYKLMGNISADSDGIIIERNNMTLDGAGFAVHGTKAPSSKGIYLSNNHNVTIRGIDIETFESGILLDANSSENTVTGNIVANNKYGINCWTYSDDNIISGNNISTNDLVGIWIVGSSQNTLTENIIRANGQYGVSLETSLNDTIYHNGFISNPNHVHIYDSNGTWDNGYPSGGNYWSDYSGNDIYSGPYQNHTDNYRGPSQNQPDSDGICDAAYVIDANNRDNYPLTKPYEGAHDIGIAKFTAAKTVIPQNYDTNITVEAINYGISKETINVTLYTSTTVLNQTQVTLPARDSATLTVTWNNSGLPSAKYNFTAIASPVPGETETTDNTMTLWITITILGDINGDGVVNILDAIVLSNAFYSTPSSSNWNPNSDINGDGAVNILDAIILANNFGKTST